MICFCVYTQLVRKYYFKRSISFLKVILKHFFLSLLCSGVCVCVCMHAGVCACVCACTCAHLLCLGLKMPEEGF